MHTESWGLELKDALKIIKYNNIEHCISPKQSTVKQVLGSDEKEVPKSLEILWRGGLEGRRLSDQLNP